MTPCRKKNKNKKKQELKGILSIAAINSNKSYPKAIEVDVSSETKSNIQTSSTPNDEQAALCSYCQEEVNDGIQCDDCRQRNHGECEAVNDRLFELYQMQEVPYICLSCRHLADKYFDNDTGCITLNTSLLDDSTMRDREMEDEQPQRDHVTVDASHL